MNDQCISKVAAAMIDLNAAHVADDDHEALGHLRAAEQNIRLAIEAMENEV